MGKPREYQSEAIIIKKTKLGEADRILTLYTPHLGKIQGVAKGVRRPRSKMAGHLELITQSQVWLARGRNLDVIRGAQTVRGFIKIKDDLWLTSCALYAIELLAQFTPEHVENQQLYTELLETLDRLETAANKELALRYYEMRLLKEVGYRPELKSCVICERRLDPEVNYFNPASGGIVCPACAKDRASVYPLSLNAQKVLRLFQDSSYDKVQQLRLDSRLNEEIEYVIGEYLRYLLERDVKSSQWLKNLRSQMRADQPGR